MLEENHEELNQRIRNMGSSSNWRYIQIRREVFAEMEKILADKKFQESGFIKPKDVALVLARKFLRNPKSLLD